MPTWSLVLQRLFDSLELALEFSKAAVVEIKAIATVTERDRRQLQTYLELSGCPLGLVLNFGAPTLTSQILRVVNNFPDGSAGRAKDA